MKSVVIFLSAATLMLLTGCEDSGQPILRGVKQSIDELLQSDSDDERSGDARSEGPADKEPSTDQSKPVLNLTLPDELKHGDFQRYDSHRHDSQSGETGVWRDEAVVGEYQTFPDVFNHPDNKADGKKESPLGVSGKLHWQAMPEGEEPMIPPLKSIEGLELEISVKTR